MQKKLLHNNYLSFLLLLLLCIWTITACTNTTNNSKDNIELKTTVESSVSNVEDSTKTKNESSLKDSEKPKEEELPPKVVDQYHQVSFVTVGDVMVHKPQLQRAYRPDTDTFDFNPSFAYVKPFLEEADYAFANLETTFAGRNQGRNVFQGYSGYPTFNTPESLATALKEAGFDFLGTANNHSLDTGLNGVINTLKALKEVGLEHTGTFQDLEDKNQLKIIEVGGLKIGVIAYTYATNGLYLKADEMYRVNTLDSYKKEKTEELYEMVKKARQEPIDLLFVMMHYGNEYWEKPEKNYQAGITQELIHLGVDMVMGSHPHTLQPLIYTENNTIFLNKSTSNLKPIAEENIERTDSEKMEEFSEIDWNLVGIYSLGNFISSQRVISQYKTDTDTSVMMKWVYQWKNDEKPTLIKVGLLPTIVVWQKDRATVLPIEEKTIEKARADKSLIISQYTESRIENAKKTVIARLTKFIPDSLINSLKKEEDGFTYLYLHPEIKQEN